jgi:hypothetical protein
MMTETDFWRIVTELEWPCHHYDATKLMFMDRSPLQAAIEFEEHFGRAKGALHKAAGERRLCDSWDDTKAHVVGLGREVWQAHLDNPGLLERRMEAYDYIESFAYAIPYERDYALLRDDGYTKQIRHVREQLERLRATDPDDISPRLHREIAAFETIAIPLMEQRWHDAIHRYHETSGPGYADTWPSHLGYLIPNIISDLEIYRLRVRVPRWNADI